MRQNSNIYFSCDLPYWKLANQWEPYFPQDSDHSAMLLPLENVNHKKMCGGVRAAAKIFQLLDLTHLHAKDEKRRKEIFKQKGPLFWPSLYFWLSHARGRSFERGGLCCPCLPSNYLAIKLGLLPRGFLHTWAPISDLTGRPMLAWQIAAKDQIHFSCRLFSLPPAGALCRGASSDVPH